MCVRVHVCVDEMYWVCLYEGCVFLCTDGKTAGASVFAISWESCRSPPVRGSFRVKSPHAHTHTHTHTHTLLPVCKLCRLQEAIMVACFRSSGGFSQGSVAVLYSSAEQNWKEHSRAGNYCTLRIECNRLIENGTGKNITEKGKTKIVWV